ncbi:protein ARMCX6 [Erinaceus europaeus]|uniref:Protein ARMCX6 n=1 Tax=Erinaceus europaeus TaxID=9365 RepID=A0A1S3AP16_ERIEU|nr:protein ARMCX6 [Erinaceus europaeus]XP_060039261.1 protein ARMCX6 [Erinaceus europaeus]
MGRAREVGWMAAGLMIGAGACYCVYRLTIGREDSEKLDEEEEEWDDDPELDEEEPEIWFDFTTMAQPWSEDGDWTEPGAPGGTEDRPSGGGKAKRTHPIKQRPFPYEHKSTQSAQSFKNVTYVLGLFKYPSIQGKVLCAQPKDAGFSFIHTVNSHLARLSFVGNTIPTPNPTLKEKALCAPDNLHMSAENQGQTKMSISEVCLEMVSHSYTSFLQQASLNLLISLTVLNNTLAKSVSDWKLPVTAAEGSRCVEVQALKPPLALSEEPVLPGQLLGAPALLSFMPLFIRNGSTQALPDFLVS